MAIEEAFLPGADTEDILEDRWLLLRAKEGDERAFELLYRRYHAAVFRVCRSRSGSPFVAEELTQEVFIKAFRNVRSLRSGTPLRRWLLRVARNTCIDYQRKVNDREISLDAVHDRLARAGRADPTADDVIGALTRRRLLQAANHALSTLEPRDRRLLWMRDVEGHSYEDLARFEGVTKHALRNRIWRTRACLHTKLRGFRDEIRGLGLVTVLFTLRHRRGAESGGKTRPVVSAWKRSPCIAGVAALAIAFGVLGLQIFKGPAHGGRDIFATTEWNAHMNETSGGGTAESSNADSPSNDGGGQLLSFHSHTRPHALLPDKTGFRIELKSKRGKPIMGVAFGLQCVGGESDVLPASGQVTAYC